MDLDDAFTHIFQECNCPSSSEVSLKDMSKINWYLTTTNHHIDGLVQDCSNSIANALELLQSCTKPLI